MNSSHSDHKWAVLLGLFLLSAVYSASRHHAATTGITDPVTAALRRVFIVPALTAANASKRWCRTNVAAYLIAPRLAARNAVLEGQVSQLELQNQYLASEGAENARLQALLDFKTNAKRAMLAAQVLSLKPTDAQDTAILARGSNDGVRIKEVVLDPQGNLAGQVVSVSPSTCDVLLLIDTQSSVGAQVEPSGRPAGAQVTIGMIQGDHTGQLRLSDIPGGCDIRPGDLVTTSGLGSIFPGRIPIGRVVSVTSDNGRFLKSATVLPAAQFDRLSEALLQQ